LIIVFFVNLIDQTLNAARRIGTEVQYCQKYDRHILMMHDVAFLEIGMK